MTDVTIGWTIESIRWSNKLLSNLIEHRGPTVVKKGDVSSILADRKINSAIKLTIAEVDWQPKLFKISNFKHENNNTREISQCMPHKQTPKDNSTSYDFQTLHI